MALPWCPSAVFIVIHWDFGEVTQNLPQCFQESPTREVPLKLRIVLARRRPPISLSVNLINCFVRFAFQLVFHGYSSMTIFPSLLTLVHCQYSLLIGSVRNTPRCYLLPPQKIGSSFHNHLQNYPLQPHRHYIWGSDLFKLDNSSRTEFRTVQST